MPADLAIHHQGPLIQVHSRHGTGLPFSKGLMATSILATGLETGHAHAIAAEIERELRSRPSPEIRADDLAAVAARAIERSAGREAADRYEAWRRVKRSGHPLVICIAGAPGVGKSTIATRLAIRLGISRVIPSDAIREVLRTVVPESVLRELHVSTYESASDGPDQADLGSFMRQAEAVASACVAVAARLVTERRSVILEGAHLLPGEMRRQLASRAVDAIVVELLLTVDEEDSHRAQLRRRAGLEPGRDGRRHLDKLEVIRRIQLLLRRLAGESGVAEHDIAHPEDLTQRIVDEVFREIEARSARTVEVGA